MIELSLQTYSVPIYLLDILAWYLVGNRVVLVGHIIYLYQKTMIRLSCRLTHG
jgi:hypothetical protein